MSLNRYLFGNAIKIVYKKSILKRYIQSYFLHESIFCLSIYMSVSKPSICFWKQLISIKWRRNKLLIHNINLAGHRKSPYCLRLLVFLKIWVIAPFWHWRSQDFPKGCCHHDLEEFCKTGFKNVLLNIIENMKWRWVKYYLRLLFTYLV